MRIYPSPDSKRSDVPPFKQKYILYTCILQL